MRVRVEVVWSELGWLVDAADCARERRDVGGESKGAGLLRYKTAARAAPLSVERFWFEKK